MSTSSIPESGFLRLYQIVGCKRRNIEPIIPVSRSSWYSGCKFGKYPPPVQLGPRTTAWRADDIRKLIAEITPTAAPTAAP
jgi:prophage regulatory protein